MKSRPEKPAVRQLTLQPDLAEVGRARQFLREICEASGLEAQRVFEVTVACSEALANAIEHSVSRGQTRLKTLVYSDRLEVQVEGAGQFHPPSSGRDRSHRGLGLPLMAYLADHLALYSGPRGGTLVSLTFYRGKTPRKAEETFLPPTILELIHENEFTSAVANTVPLGICVLDGDLHVRWANPAFQPFLQSLVPAPEAGAGSPPEVPPQLAALAIEERLRTVSRTSLADFWPEAQLTTVAGEPSWWQGYALPLFGERSEPPYQVLLVVADQTERKLGEEAARWRSGRDELLSRTAMRLLESRDPQGLVDELCGRVMEFLDCQVFFNYLAQPDDGRGLQLNAYAGLPTEEAERISWLEKGVAVCGCVARDGEMILAEDIQREEDVRTALVKGYGVQAYCCHPLIVQGRTIGTLSFGTKTRIRFSPEEVDLMRSVAGLVAMAMDRLEMEQRLEQSEERYRALLEEHESLRRRSSAPTGPPAH